MAERYSFFDAVLGDNGQYDRTYSSEDMASYFSSFVGNGVYANPANSLMINANSGLSLSVSIGKAWIKGYYYELTENPKAINIEHGDSVNPRIDLVVLSLNMSKRLIEVKVIQGASAIVPQEPSISRTKDVYDLVLAKVSVPAGCTAITQDMITDTRFDKDKCGIVSGIIEQIDTTGLFTQYDSAFTSWFKSIQGILEGDVAGNLANQVSEVKEQANTNALRIQEQGEKMTEIEERITPISLGGTGAGNAVSALNNLGISWGTAPAPANGKPNTIYIQLL